MLSRYVATVSSGFTSVALVTMPCEASVDQMTAGLLFGSFARMRGATEQWSVIIIFRDTERDLCAGCAHVTIEVLFVFGCRQLYISLEAAAVDGRRWCRIQTVYQQSTPGR